MEEIALGCLAHCLFIMDGKTGTKAPPDAQLLAKLAGLIEKKTKSCRIRVDCLFKEEEYFERRMLLPHVKEIYALAKYKEISGFFVDLALKLNLKRVLRYFRDDSRPGGNHLNQPTGLNKNGRPTTVTGKQSKRRRDYSQHAASVSGFGNDNSKGEDSKGMFRSKTFERPQNANETRSRADGNNQRRSSAAHERKNHFFDEFIKVNETGENLKQTTRKPKASKTIKNAEPPRGELKGSKAKRISVKLEPPKSQSRCIKRTFSENFVLKKQRRVSKDIININKMGADALRQLNLKAEHSGHVYKTPEPKNIIIEDEFTGENDVYEFLGGEDNQCSIKFSEIYKLDK